MAKKLSNVAASLFAAINAAPAAREAILASAQDEIRAEILAEIERLRPLDESEVAVLADLNEALAGCQFAGSLSARSNWINVVLLGGTLPTYDAVKYEIVFDGSLCFTGIGFSSFADKDGEIHEGGNCGAQDVSIEARFVKRGSVQPSTSVLKQAISAVVAEKKAAAKKPTAVSGLASMRAAAAAAVAAKRAANAL